MTEDAATRRVRERYGVPGTLALRVAPAEVLAWVAGYEVAVRATAARPDDLPLAGVGGRRALRRVDVGGQPLLVREYHKGGLLRRVRGRAMWGPWRPLQELVLQRGLLALGVPVARCVGCVVLRRRVGWRGFLLLEEEEGARDLEAILHGWPTPGRAPRRMLLETAGRAVRSLHEAGVPHPDLHPKNLLVTPDDQVLLLDLDKAVAARGRLGEEQRLTDLARLARAIEKHRLKGLVFGPRDALRFLTGYAGSRQAALGWLGRIRDRLGPGLGLRVLWWRLLGEARPWRPPMEREPT